MTEELVDLIKKTEEEEKKEIMKKLKDILEYEEKWWSENKEMLEDSLVEIERYRRFP